MPVHVAEGRALYRLNGGSLVRIDAAAGGTPPPAGATVGRDLASPTALDWGATGATATALTTLTPTGNQTDRSGAINTAIANASSAGGGIVHLEAGEYWIAAPIRNRSNVMVRGVRTAGQDATTIIRALPGLLSSPSWSSGVSMLTVNGLGLANMTYKDLHCDMRGDVLDGTTVSRLNAYCAEFRDATNVVMDGVSVEQAFTYHIVIAATVGFAVRNCHVYNDLQGLYDQLDGIHIFDCIQGDVVDNLVENGAGGPTGDADDGLVCRAFFDTIEDVSYRNNDVLGGQHGHNMQLAGGDHNILRITITGNTFRGTAVPRGIRFGYYGATTSTLDTVLIDGNHFIDNTSYCVDLTDGPHTNITVTDNTSVNSGGYNVDAGGGNVVSNNT